mgnify:CR=1 FL=1
MPVHGYDGSEFLIPFGSMRSLELKIPPLLLCLVFASLIAALVQLWPQASLPFPGSGLLALISLVSGLVVMFGGAIAFRRHQTTLDPRDPAKTSRIVTGGPFRFTRNPMYLGMALMLGGEAAWYASPPGALLAAIFCLYITELQIKPEERMLLERFGQEYADFMARVRRWL